MSVSRAQPGRESWVWAPDRRGQPCGGQCCCPKCPGEHTEAGEGRGRAHRLLTQLFLGPPRDLLALTPRGFLSLSPSWSLPGV